MGSSKFSRGTVAGDAGPDNIAATEVVGSVGDEAAETKPVKKEKRKTYSRDDIGNAERLVRKHGNEMRFDEGLGEWVIWQPDDGVWKVDLNEPMRRAKGIAREIVKDASDRLMYDPEDKQAQKLLDWGHKTGNLSRLEAMLKVARSEDDMAVPNSDFDADPSLFNCPNGVIELRESGINFRETRKEDLLTKQGRVRYTEGAKHPMWDNYLNLFLPELDLRAWVQKLCGYSLYGANPERRIVFAWGPTSSGKTTLAELMLDCLGGYGGPFSLSMMRENQDERARADIVRAIGQRFISATEASSEWHLHADMVKRSTGNDRMIARLPHRGTYIERVPAFTPWIVTNNIPTINGADTALYRRLAVALFPHSIDKGEENVNFRQKLVGSKGGLEAVFAWAVEGWNLYVAEGLDNPPEEVALKAMKMRDEFSDLDRAISLLCEVGPAMEGFHESPAVLYDAYCRWHEANNGHPREQLSATAFGRALQMRGYLKKQIKMGEDRKPTWRRLGLRLRDSWEGKLKLG